MGSPSVHAACASAGEGESSWDGACSDYARISTTTTATAEKASVPADIMHERQDKRSTTVKALRARTQSPGSARGRPESTRLQAQTQPQAGCGNEVVPERAVSAVPKENSHSDTRTCSYLLSFPTVATPSTTTLPSILVPPRPARFSSTSRRSSDSHDRTDTARLSSASYDIDEDTTPKYRPSIGWHTRYQFTDSAQCKVPFSDGNGAVIDSDDDDMPPTTMRSEGGIRCVISGTKRNLSSLR